MRSLYRDLSTVLSAGLVVVGVLIALRTWQLGSGGGLGYLLGALFVIAGLGRLYLGRRLGP
jgi:hypothetical protein